MFGIKLKENTHVLDTYTRKKESLDEIVTRRHMLQNSISDSLSDLYLTTPTFLYTISLAIDLYRYPYANKTGD